MYIDITEGYILEDIDGKFLNEKFEWEEVLKKEAYLHPGNLNEIVKIIDEKELSVYDYHAAMRLNGILLLGISLSRIGDNNFIVAPD